ncbi:hypothetical protein I79_021664 [Cricetulus griseus]|uniref:Uncharacterized protein n=1 Tax=Cricetulus griseus TaxID=10029 RepID=G3ID91_CRIGR|nr:hypothetical protein I79_021664 [Cricetulus griseus]
MAVTLQPGIVGINTLQNSGDKTVLSLDRKFEEKKKKVKSTNDRSCSVGTTVMEMPDSIPCNQLYTSAPLLGCHSRTGLCLPNSSQRHSMHAQALCLA